MAAAVWNSARSTPGENDPSAAKTYTITPGTQLNSSIGYLDARVDGTGLDETLENKQAKTYTVVGFYDRLSYAMYSAVGPVAITAGGQMPTPASFAEVYLTMSGVQNTEEVQDNAEALFPGRPGRTSQWALALYGNKQRCIDLDNVLWLGAHPLYRDHRGVHLAHLQRLRHLGC